MPHSAWGSATMAVALTGRLRRGSRVVQHRALLGAYGWTLSLSRCRLPWVTFLFWIYSFQPAPQLGAKLFSL